MSNRMGQTIFIVLLVLIAILVGVRDLEIGADTFAYQRVFESISACRCLGEHEPGFGAFTLLVSLISKEYAFFLFSVSMVLFSLCYLSTSQFLISLKGRVDIYAFMFIFSFLFLNPLFLQAHINALRQGMATALLLLAFVSLASQRIKSACILIFLSVTLHYSMGLVVPFLALFFLPRGGWFYGSVFFLIIFFFLYVTGLSEQLIGALSPSIHSFVSDYGYRNVEGYETGVRYDFAVFTLLVLLFCAYLSSLFSFFHQGKILKTLSAAAIMSSYPFFMLGWGYFSNRYLFASWLISSFTIGAAFYLILNKLPTKNLISSILFFLSAAFFSAGLL